jgi:hypothetical protein
MGRQTVRHRTAGEITLEEIGRITSKQSLGRDTVHYVAA